nr:hypothetical protein CFP56_00872 [Quercus suber]
MSFGFSLSDFIELADRTHARCSEAGREYQGLAESVVILRDILDGAEVHLRKDVPGAPNKQQALVIARQACETALDEVDVLLRKYPSLGSKANKRIIDRMRFITKDVDGLKKRLEISASHLQMCLTSLMSLSMLGVRTTVDQLLLEYKHGRREQSSVISVALVNHQDVDEDDALEQLEHDLLGGDVHPDAIELHRSEIKKWLLQTIETERQLNLLERESTVETAHRLSQEQLWEGSILCPPSTSTSSVKTKGRENALTGPLPITRRVGGASDASDEDLYNSSVVRGATQDTTRSLRPSDIGHLDLSSPLSELPCSLSRRSSLRSHASKESIWHPSGEPDPKYVAKMLLIPLTIDPIRGSIDIETSSFYFKRAFHQQDYRDRGFLTRHEVIFMCREALSEIDTQLDDSYLTNLVHAGDHNQDGMVDKDEFLIIMHNVLEAIVTYGDIQMKTRFQAVIRHADTEAKDRQMSQIATSLPWGFGRNSVSPIFDLVEGTQTASIPPLLPLSSFTLMAVEIATRSVGIIDEADKHWSASLPQDLRNEFRQTLDRVRNVAIRFTCFFAPKTDQALSDLDAMLTMLHIVESKTSSTVLSDNLAHLRNIRDQCADLASHIRGYVWHLGHQRADDSAFGLSSWPTSRTLTVDLANWKRTRMETWAWLISEQSNQLDWIKIPETLKTIRAWYIKYTVSASVQGEQPVHGSSSSSRSVKGRAQVSLNTAAMTIARNFAAEVRRQNTNQRQYLRRQRRMCTVKFRLNGEDHTTFFSKGIKLFVDDERVDVSWKVDAPRDHDVEPTGPFPWIELTRGCFDTEDEHSAREMQHC